MRFFQLVAILSLALLGAVLVPGVEALPDAYEFRFRNKFSKPEAKLNWAYTNPVNSHDEAVKRDPRSIHRAIPPAKRTEPIPSTSKLDSVNAALQQRHRIDISDREYASKNKPVRREKRSSSRSSEGGGLAIEGYLNTRVDGEMFPSTPESVRKTRSGWKVLRRAD